MALIFFNFFTHVEDRPEENSSYYSNVQQCTITCTLDSFNKNIRICGYTYITLAVQILHYCDQDRCVNEVVQP